MPTVNGQVSKQISADEDRQTSQLRDRQTYGWTDRQARQTPKPTA